MGCLPQGWQQRHSSTSSPQGWVLRAGRGSQPPPPHLCLLCSLLPTAASVSSQLVMDDHNNAACLAPWQTVLAELMKACRLHTQGAPPGQQALLSLELASSLVEKDFFLVPLRWCNRRQKESRFRGWRLDQLKVSA